MKIKIGLFTLAVCLVVTHVLLTLGHDAVVRHVEIALAMTGALLELS